MHNKKHIHTEWGFPLSGLANKLYYTLQCDVDVVCAHPHPYFVFNLAKFCRMPPYAEVALLGHTTLHDTKTQIDSVRKNKIKFKCGSASCEGSRTCMIISGSLTTAGTRTRWAKRTSSRPVLATAPPLSPSPRRILSPRRRFGARRATRPSAAVDISSPSGCTLMLLRPSEAFRLFSRGEGLSRNVEAWIAVEWEGSVTDYNSIVG